MGSHCRPHMCFLSLPCSVTAVRMADGLTFVIYEFWETEEEWKRLVQSCPYPYAKEWGCGKVGLTVYRLRFLDPEDRQRGWGGW